MDALVYAHHHQQRFTVPSNANSPANSPPVSAPASPRAYPYTDAMYHSRMSSPYPQQDFRYQSQPRHAYTSSLQTTSAGPAPHEDLADDTSYQPSASATAKAPAPQHNQPAPTDAELAQSANTVLGGGEMTGLSRPLTAKETGLLSDLDRLKFFLATAPSRWGDDGSDGSDADMDQSASGPPVPRPSGAHSHPALNRFLLPNSEYVSCVLWGGLYHISGTDIVRALVFRFEAFGRPVRNMKKFEEGVFSDLRNLKPGVDACLEEPKSPFLDLLFKYQCIRTQKKQKVFYWFSVPHDRLFLDALERDLKRERMGQEPTTTVVGEPALSFKFDAKRTLYEQFSKAHGAREGESELETAVRIADESRARASADPAVPELDPSGADSTDESGGAEERKRHLHHGKPYLSMLFEGSPTYKQRRKKQPKPRRPHPALLTTEDRRNPLPAVVDMGAGYGAGDGDLSAADMFLTQAREEFGPGREAARVKTVRSSPPVMPQVNDMALAQAHREAYTRTQQLSGPGTGPSQSLDMSALAGEIAVPALVSPPLANGYAYASQAAPQARHTYPLPGPSTQPAFLQPAQHTGLPAAAHAQTLPGRPYACPLFSCGRRFRSSDALKRHTRLHTTERPHACARCSRRFVHAANAARCACDADAVFEGEVDERDEMADVDSEGDEAPMYDLPQEVASLNVQEAYYPTGVPAAAAYAQAQMVASPDAYGAQAQAQWAPGYSPPGDFRYLAPAYGEPISAPSDRASFAYAPSTGPVRRFRSVTPNYARGADHIRRPMTAGSAYHPYAYAGSTHSSPGNATVPLAYEAGLPVARVHSHSRRASAEQQQYARAQSQEQAYAQAPEPPYARAPSQEQVYARAPSQEQAYPAPAQAQEQAYQAQAPVYEMYAGSPQYAVYRHESPASDHEQDTGMYVLPQQQQHYQPPAPAAVSTSYYALSAQQHHTTL